MATLIVQEAEAEEAVLTGESLAAQTLSDCPPPPPGGACTLRILVTTADARCRAIRIRTSQIRERVSEGIGFSPWIMLLSKTPGDDFYDS